MKPLRFPAVFMLQLCVRLPQLTTRIPQITKCGSDASSYVNAAGSLDKMAASRQESTGAPGDARIAHEHFQVEGNSLAVQLFVHARQLLLAWRSVDL